MPHSVLLLLPCPEIWLRKLVDRLFGGTPRGMNLKVLWEANNRRCYFCNDEIPLSQASRDHLQPRSRGGSNSNENIRLYCKSCNSAKQDMTEAEYWKALRDDQIKYGKYLKRPLNNKEKQHVYWCSNGRFRRHRH